MFDVASEAIIAQPINIDIESPRFSKDDDLKMVFLTYQRKFAANLHLLSGDFPASHFSWHWTGNPLITIIPYQ